MRRDDELNGASTILADMGDQGKYIAGRDLKLLGPTIEDALVIR